MAISALRSASEHVWLVTWFIGAFPSILDGCVLTSESSGLWSYQATTANNDGDLA